MDYASLKAESIRLAQQLSGEQWTDYNAHDPGVTILEQLCYAITDLGYRTNFDIVDILAHDLPPEAPVDDNAFFPPDTVLSTAPVTVADYRKLLIDQVLIPRLKPQGASSPESPPAEKVPPLTNAWLEQITDHPQGIKGLYRALIQVDDDFISRKGQEGREEEIEREVRASFSRHRNLCEDLEEVIILKEYALEIKTEIDLAPDAIAEPVLARLLFELEMSLSPRIIRHNWEELRDEGLTMDRIFDGPRPLHGFIRDSQLQPLTRIIYRSRMERAVTGVEGVRRIRKLELFRKGIPVDADVINLESEGYVFPVLDGLMDFPRSGSKEEYPIQLFQNNSLVVPNYYATLQILSGLWAGQEIGRKASFQFAHPHLFRTSAPARLDHFIPLRDLFPAVYGIGKSGLPIGADARRRAQAKQLQSYLLLFDQVIADYLSQLGNLRRLFSTRPDIRHTYFTRLPARLDLDAISDTALLRLKLMLNKERWERLKSGLERLANDLGQLSETSEDYPRDLRNSGARHWSRELIRSALRLTGGERIRARLMKEKSDDILPGEEPLDTWKAIVIRRETERWWMANIRRQLKNADWARLAQLPPGEAEKELHGQLETILKETGDPRPLILETILALSPDQALECLLEDALDRIRDQELNIADKEFREIKKMSPDSRFEWLRRGLDPGSGWRPEGKIRLGALTKAGFEEARTLSEFLDAREDLPTPVDAPGDPARFAAAVREIIDRDDPASRRRNRFVDHLLARFGEEFFPDLLNTLHNLERIAHEGDRETELLDARLRLLNRIEDLNRNQAGGFDYLQPAEAGNCAGLIRKLNLLTGLESWSEPPLSAALNQLKAAKFRLIPVSEGADPEEKAQYDLLTLGHNPDLYSYAEETKDGQKFHLLLFKGASNTIELFRSEVHQQLAPRKKKWIEFAGRFQRRTEGFHLVETVLLRSGQQVDPDGLFSFRIKILLPAWSPRMTQQDFKKLLRDVVAANVPAHLTVDLHWLGIGEMEQFERLYTEWRQLKRQVAGQPGDLEKVKSKLIRTSKRLVKFLKLLPPESDG